MEKLESSKATQGVLTRNDIHSYIAVILVKSLLLCACS